MNDPAPQPEARPSLLGHRLVMVAWGALPAALMILAGGLGTGHYNLPDTDAGGVLSVIALLGGPFILYAWSAVLLRSCRVKYWAAWAILLGVGMCAANLFLGIGGCVLISEIV